MNTQTAHAYSSREIRRAARYMKCAPHNAATLPDGNKWEVWVSVKYTGPAYVKDSTSPNQIFWDQVVLVRPGTVKH